MSGTGIPKRQCSISCTDHAWKRVKERAKRRGMSISGYLIECALTVNPPLDEKSHPLVLDESEQQEIRDIVADFADYMGSASDGKVMTSIRRDILILVTIQMINMKERLGPDHLRGFLVRLFGRSSAEDILRGFYQRIGNSEPPQ